MTQNALFVSFWNIGLFNLPEGRFKNTRLSPQEAKTLIDAARAQDSLLGLSHADLAAPYGKKELKNQLDLIDVLQKSYDIGLDIDDFFSASHYDGESFKSIRPLNIINIGSGRSLMVINCHFELTGERNLQASDLGFRLSPDTVEFNLFEAE